VNWVEVAVANFKLRHQVNATNDLSKGNWDSNLASSKYEVARQLLRVGRP
jgi:hypothetical protein